MLQWRALGTAVEVLCACSAMLAFPLKLQLGVEFAPAGSKINPGRTGIPPVCRTPPMMRNWQREVTDGKQGKASFHA